VLGTTGFAIVVVSHDGKLLGCAHGSPPEWVATAGAAEAYAVYKVLALNPFVPHIVTDCLGALRTLEQGPGAATAAIWRLIGGCLAGTSWQEAAAMVTWMPAHGSRTSVGSALKSDHTPVTGTDWRANRLADALAKAAAARFRVPGDVRRTVSVAMKAYEHTAAVVGVATRASNNHLVSATNPDGSYALRRLRDAAPPARGTRPTSARSARPAQAPGKAPATPAPTASGQLAPTNPLAQARDGLASEGSLGGSHPAHVVGLDHSEHGGNRASIVFGQPATANPRTQTRDGLASEVSPGPAAPQARPGAPTRSALQGAAAVHEARFIQAWHREMAARPRAPATGPSARDRLEALRLRIARKQRES